VVFIHKVVIFAKLRQLAMAVFLCAMESTHQPAQIFFNSPWQIPYAPWRAFICCPEIYQISPGRFSYTPWRKCI
jgi:hypothetical protein